MNTALDFEFDGIHSSTFGVYKINLESGVMLEEGNYLANKKVEGFRLNNHDRTHKTSIVKEPLVITMVLYLNKNTNEEDEQRIKRWLETDDFCKLKFEGQTYEYNAILQNEVRLLHDAKDDGYIELEFLTDSPYKYSSDIIIKGECNGEKTISLLNNGSKITYPVIEIIAVSTNGVEIKNVETGQFFNLEGTYENLTLDILNQYEELHSEGNFTNLYENHNGQFIALQVGRNTLQIKGAFYYTIRYKNVYL